jgi:hypothetical protein
VSKTYIQDHISTYNYSSAIYINEEKKGCPSPLDEDLKKKCDFANPGMDAFSKIEVIMTTQVKDMVCLHLPQYWSRKPFLVDLGGLFIYIFGSIKIKDKVVF